MASESNATLHNAMRLHIDNLRLLAKPLDQLQKEIPSLADLDEGSEANIAEVSFKFCSENMALIRKMTERLSYHFVTL